MTRAMIWQSERRARSFHHLTAAYSIAATAPARPRRGAAVAAAATLVWWLVMGGPVLVGPEPAPELTAVPTVPEGATPEEALGSKSASNIRRRSGRAGETYSLDGGEGRESDGSNGELHGG